MKNKVMFVCNEGGHYSQMLCLKSLFPKFDSVLITDNRKGNLEQNNLGGIKVEYAMAMSNRREKLMKSNKKITRWSYAFGYLKLFIQCLNFWIKYRPKVIVSTGSNMAVAMFFWGYIFGSKLVYIESRAKVKTKNVSGKICERWSDKIIVQWPEMLKVYGKKAEYFGTLI